MHFGAYSSRRRALLCGRVSALENSAAVLAGTADASTLGVSAAGPLTLVFRLSEKDDNFLAKLTLPGAMPCDEAFFESTRAPTA